MRTPHFCATDHAQPASYRPCLRDVGFSDLEGWPAVDFVLRNEFHLHRLPNTRRMDESPTPLLDILRVLEDPRMTPLGTHWLRTTNQPCGRRTVEVIIPMPS